MNLDLKTLISTSDPKAWLAALRLCRNFDIYHMPQYHILEERMGEGRPYLFFFQYKDDYAALPFLVRPVADVTGLETTACNDITSVYGYPGIVTSINENDENAVEFRELFNQELLTVFKQMSVVAFFSRTNPLLQNTWLLDGFTEIVSLSTTIAVDLSKSDEEQLSQMTKGHKYDIRKARKNGVIVEEDPYFQNIDDFIRIYNETMKRNEANERYYFPKGYYLQLKENFGESIRLYFARHNGVPISASLFFFQGNIIQYHLSGSLPEFFPLNGAKLILDEVRRLGTQNRYSWLHLGGGVGSSEDSLFRFKAGFSKLRLQFQIVRKIVDQNVYAELCDKRIKWTRNNNHILPESNFFPAYRKPIIPKETD